MRLLFLSEIFVDDINAISRCIKSLLKGFKDEIIDIIVIGNDNYDFYYDHNVHVFVIKNYVIKKYNFYNIIRYIFLLFYWPIYSIKNKKNMHLKSLELLNNYHYDAIIAVNMSYLSVSVLNKLKYRIKNIKSIVLQYDPIAAPVSAYTKGFRKYLFFILRIKQFYSYFINDFIILMKSNYKFYKNYFFNLFNYKIKYFDFPTFYIDKQTSFHHDYDMKNIKFIFFGSLLEDTRPIDYCLKLLYKLNSIINFCFDIYGRNGCKNITEFYSKMMNVNNKGIINSNLLNYKIYEYDILISIGNKNFDMLPSKIFQMFMTGKPIIHFAKSKEDCCNEYMERYGNALIIYEEDDLDYSLNRLLEFLKDYKIVPIEKVKEIFKENTPEYQANLIKELVLDN